MARRTNKHHIVPRSRFPRDTPKRKKDWNNIVELDEKFHAAWHACFANLTPEEAIEFIKMVMIAGVKWDNKELHALREFIKQKYGGE